MGKFCHQCGNPKFGLVRQHYRGKVFCKIICKENYIRGEARTPPTQFELPLPDNPKAYDVIS